jgi:hypothetical protein
MLLKGAERLRGLIADMNASEIADHVQFSYKDTEIRTETDYERASRLIPEVHKPWLDSWRQAALDALEEIERETVEKYVKGPLDADGVMWHSGDMSDSNWGVIEGIAYENGVWIISGHDTSAPWVRADSLHHAPTIEGVLTEFLDAYQRYEGDGYDVVAKYAAKLQLREGA